MCNENDTKKMISFLSNIIYNEKKKIQEKRIEMIKA